MPGRVRYDPRIDYYAALGLTLTASADQIQGAFRQRAKQLHPDRNSDTEATRQFQQLSEAYAILSDPLVRAEYDDARASVNLHTAFQALHRDRDRERAYTKRSGTNGSYWRQVLRGLIRSPYRYVFVLLALVATGNIGFILITGAFNVDAPSTTGLPSSPSTAVEGLPVSPGPADSIHSSPVPLTANPIDPANPTCDTGAQIGSPHNNEVITGAFEINGLVTAVFQLDWAPVQYDQTGHPQLPAWQVLSRGTGTDSNGILAPAAMTATIDRPGQIYLRLTVGDPIGSQPIQVCEITVTLKS